MTSPAFAAARLRLARTVWWAAASVVTAVALVVPVVVPDPETTVPAALPAVLGVTTAVAALVGVLVLDRGLLARRPADGEDAARELTARLVMQVALLEAPVLLAVALAAVVGPPWVVLPGALPALAGLLVLHPGRARLARLRARWDAAGPPR